MHRLRDLEDEDRIAVPLGAAVPSADIGRHVAHAHVLVLQVDARRLLVVGPAAQHVLDARIGTVGVVRRVRVVHRHDVGQHRRPDVVVVVGRDAHQLRALDQEGRVADISRCAPDRARARRAQGGGLRRRAAARRRDRGSSPSFPAWRAAARRLAPAACTASGNRQMPSPMRIFEAHVHDMYPRRSNGAKSDMV